MTGILSAYPIVVGGWLLFNAKSAMFYLYQGVSMLNFQWDDDEVRFVLDQHA